MANSDPVFIHPLLGADDAWEGYYVEFAPNHVQGDLLGRLCASPQLDGFDHRALWFFPAGCDTCESISLFERAVTLFPAKPSPGDVEQLAEREASLRQSRHKVGLIAAPDGKLPGNGTWDYVAIECAHGRSLPPYTLIGLASRTRLIATNMQTHGDRQWALSNACHLCTSEFLLTRQHKENAADVTRMKLLRLLTLVQDDADTSQLDAIFREEPKLSYSLLRLVNSAALAPRSPITSFSQAINLLGRRQLQRWLQLLVYADPNNGMHANPLLQKAAARGHLLELLARHLTATLTTDETEEIAFMIGTFSLLDVLLDRPMAEILQQLPLTKVANNALATHGGLLGKLLAIIDATERRDLQSATTKLESLGIDGCNHLVAQLDAFSWAAKIRPLA